MLDGSTYVADENNDPSKCNKNFTINEVILSDHFQDERTDNLLSRILNGDTSLIEFTNNSLLVDELNSVLLPRDDNKNRHNAVSKIVELAKIGDGNECSFKVTIEQIETDDSCEQTHFVKIKSNKDGLKPIKIWECGICRKEFQHQYTLMRHLPTHTDVRKYACKVCGKAFRQMSTLSQHKAIHTNVRPHVCNVCNKAFNRISTLISHKRTHSEIKPHKCPVCAKGFHQKGNMRNHVFTHTNERPYKCDTCSKGFNQKSNLMWHKVHIHGNPKENFCYNVCSAMSEQKHGKEKHKVDENISSSLRSSVENNDNSDFDVNFNNCIIIEESQNNGGQDINWNNLQYVVNDGIY